MYWSKPALAYPTRCIHGLKSCTVLSTKGTVSIAWVIIIHTRFLTRGQVLFTCPTSITKRGSLPALGLCARRAHRRHPSCRSWYKKRDCFCNPLFHHLHNNIYFFLFFLFFYEFMKPFFIKSTSRPSDSRKSAVSFAHFPLTIPTGWNVLYPQSMI